MDNNTHSYEDYLCAVHDSADKMPSFDSSEIRLSIFLIFGVCVGLPALIWASRYVYLHEKIRGWISAFIIFLLITDLIQLLSSVLIVAKLGVLVAALYLNTEFFQFWSGLHWCGLQLHQLVALDGVLTLKYPQCAQIFSRPFYIVISSFLPLFSVASALIVYIYTLAPFLLIICSCLALLSSLVVTFVISCTTSVKRNTRSVLTVAMVNLLMLYLPFALVLIVDYLKMAELHQSWCVMSLCLMSLRVISDPLLCVLVCREHLKVVKTPEMRTERNTKPKHSLVGM